MLNSSRFFANITFMRGHGIESTDDFITLKAGAHVCTFYENDQEHSTVLADLLRDSLNKNERVLYIADSNHPVDIVTLLAKTEMDTKPYLQNDQFMLKKSTELPVRGKDFDSGKLFAFFSKEYEKTKRQRYSNMRIISEMTCVMLGPPGSERLTAYETVIERLIAKGNHIAVCMFDRRRFLPELLCEALKIHPFAIIGTKLYTNFYYIPTEERITDDPHMAEFNHSIKMILSCNKTNPTRGKGAT